MFARFLPIALFRGHWKALSEYSEEAQRPDWIARSILLGGAIIAFAVVLLTPANVPAPGPILSAVSLLSGVFLAAWGQIAALRLKMTERAKDQKDVEKIDRDSLDETAAHLLVASMLSALAAFSLVAAINLSVDPKTGAVDGFFAALAASSALYVFLLFLIAVPRLYVAYANYHDIRPELSGTHKN